MSAWMLRTISALGVAGWLSGASPARAASSASDPNADSLAADTAPASAPYVNLGAGPGASGMSQALWVHRSGRDVILPFGGAEASLLLDARRDRGVLYGGTAGAGAGTKRAYALDLTNAFIWSTIGTGSTEPAGRYAHAAIADSAHDRMIVLAGRLTGDALYQVPFEVWTLAWGDSLPTWLLLTPSGSPPWQRSGHTAIYDPIRDRIIVFGGYRGALGLLNDLWELQLGDTPRWQQLTPGGGGPSPRQRHTAVYDPGRRQMVVFGGDDGAPCGDVWALNLDGDPTWVLLAGPGAGPTARYGHTATYDPRAGNMVVFGGFDGQYRNDVWVLDLAHGDAWTPVALQGAPLSPRAGASAALDLARDRIVIQGGLGHAGALFDWDAITLNPSPAWLALDPGEPFPGRENHSLVLDPDGRRLLLYGGNNFSQEFADLWQLPLDVSGDWSPVVAAGTPPDSRTAHAAAYVPSRRSMIVFGGLRSSFAFLNDLWELTLDPTPGWSPLVASGPPPSPRQQCAAVFDPVRNRILFIGGQRVNYILTNEVWELSLSPTPTWTLLAPLGTPPSPRVGHRAVYDARRDRVLLFGGLDTERRNDVWELRLAPTASWVQVQPGGSAPSPRFYSSLVYDDALDRLVMVGGIDTGSLNDAWELRLAPQPMWAPIPVTGFQPGRRHGHAGVYDELSDAVYIAGGYLSGGGLRGYYPDTWSLRRADVPTPVMVSAVDSRVTVQGVELAWLDPSASGGCMEVLRRQVALEEWVTLGRACFDGEGFARFTDRPTPTPGDYVYAVQRRDHEPEGQVEVSIHPAGATTPIWVGPNPSVSAWGIRFATQRAGSVMVEVLDLAGRRCLFIDLGGLEPGEHQAAVELPRGARPGIYVVRILSEDRVVGAARAVRLRQP